MRHVEVPRAERDALLRGDYAEALRLYKQGLAKKAGLVKAAQPSISHPVEGHHWSEKLTIQEVREIRSSKESGSELAVRFGVSEATVGAVRRRERYRWIQ